MLCLLPAGNNTTTMEMILFLFPASRMTLGDGDDCWNTKLTLHRVRGRMITEIPTPPDFVGIETCSDQNDRHDDN